MQINIKLITFFYFLLVSTLVVYYVEVYLCGNYFWTFWPADFWKIPNLYKYLNFTPILGGEQKGWDGQFYYYISNDLLGLNDTYNHIDSPSYRWQRIGLPIAAKIVSILMFSDIVLSIHFILANILIVTFGLYFLMKYYKEIGINPLFALFWGLSLGVLITLTNGLPDAAADALFLIAFISYLRNKSYMYILFMSFAILTREGYVVAAFFIFCLEVFYLLKNKNLKKDFSYILKYVILYSIPGVIFLLWQIYLTIHFNILPSAQANKITDYPFVQIFNTLIRLYNSNDYIALFGLFIFVSIILLTLVLSFIKIKENKKYIPIFFLTVLILSLGEIVMYYYRDFLKAITVFIAILPLLVSTFNIKVKFLVYIVLLLSLIFSIKQYPEVRSYGFEPTGFKVEKSNSFKAKKLDSFESQIEIFSSTSNQFYKSLFNIDREIFYLKVKNNSNDIWFSKSNKDGNYATMLTYHFFDPKDLSKPIGGDYRSKLSKDIYPGEESMEKMIVYYPKKSGEYILRVTLLQHPVAFFYNVGGAYKDYEIEVK